MSGYVILPQDRYKKFIKWRKRQQGKCTVLIDNPRMRIKGKTYPNETDDSCAQTYIAFYGVPYAQPPVGPLRFRPPQPLRVTSPDIPLLKAYDNAYTCIHHWYRKNPKERRFELEDCLYLNIYIPKKPKAMSNKVPVLAYIHGGGFQPGSGDIHDIKPDALIKQNLVLVTINSRMNVTGFFNTRTEICSGNAGLKDQVYALRWIRANIGKFGGDPNNVTITGHSAGATCVNLHMISPLSEGLFHKAIVQSGGIYTRWGFPVDEENKPKRIFAKGHGLENELRNVLATYLRHESAYEVLDRVDRMIAKNAIELESKKLVIFSGPSKEMKAEGAFIPHDVKVMMKTAKPVPLIAGIVELEGYKFVIDRRDVSKNNYVVFLRDDKKFNHFLMQNLRWSEETANDYKYALTMERYIPKLWLRSRQRTRDDFATLVTDIWFRRFYDNFKIGKTPAPYYVYHFGYLCKHHEMRPTRDRENPIRIIGPTHGDEILYLYRQQDFYKMSKGEAMRAQVKHVSEHMCSMWGNFCRTGIPKSDHENITWLPHTEKKPYYLNIESTSRLMNMSLNEGRWENLNEFLENTPTVEQPEIEPESPFTFFPAGTGRFRNKASPMPGVWRLLP